MPLQPHVPRCCLLCVFKLLEIAIGIQHTLSPCRFVILETTTLESQASRQTHTHIYTHRKYNKIPGTYAVYLCMWRRPGCFPGAWRRCPWHFQVASLHLQSIMDLCPLHVIIFLFFLPEQAYRPADAARGAKRLVYIFLRCTPRRSR